MENVYRELEIAVKWKLEAQAKVTQEFNWELKVFGDKELELLEKIRLMNITKIEQL